MCQACGFADIVHGSKMRRRAFVFGAATAGALTVVASAHAQGRKSQSKQAQQTSAPPKPENVMTPDEALARLMEGNRRYQKGIAKRHDFVAEREALVGGQNPYAAILSCADSRIAPEYAFDSSRGDLFVVRVAGNFANPDNIASMEYAVEVLKTPLILVLCHEACGAVKIGDFLNTGSYDFAWPPSLARRCSGPGGQSSRWPSRRSVRKRDDGKRPARR